MTYDSTRDRICCSAATAPPATTTISGRGIRPRSEWEQITVTGCASAARYGIWMFYDAVRDKVYVFGSSWGGYENWEYDPELNKWTNRTVNSPPAGVSRSYFDVTFDSTRGKIVDGRRLLQQRLQHGHLGVGHDRQLWTQEMPAAARRFPTAATTIGSPTIRSDA